MSAASNENVTWQKGTECIARYDFPGSGKDDLPFKKGDVLTIIKATKDPNWYKAKTRDGKEGMIPANYVQKREVVKLNAMLWFHGKITREKAEELLQPRADGLFLVRESTNYPGDYTLCVVFGGKVEHYRVIFKENRMTIDEEEFFENLTQLVEHYENDADGLCTQLITPLAKKGGAEYSVDSNDFVKAGWAISRDEISLGRSIGKGNFGDVIEGVYRNQKVAIKTLKDKSTAAQKFLAEASVMTTMQHPNLVQLIGVALGDPLYIVLEFMAKGSLIDYLRSRGRAVITRTNQWNFSCHVAAGMMFLEEKGLVHRDLAARNVLVADTDIAKVSDFGLARDESASQEGGKFPIKWTAPEALRHSRFSTKSDVWSYGIFLWELYSFGRVPYPRVPLSDVVKHVEKGYRMEAPEGCPDKIHKLMLACWDLEPEKRLSFSQIYKQLREHEEACI